MIVYQPNFLFLDSKKACQLTLFVLLLIQLTRVYQGIKVLVQDFTRYFLMKSKDSAFFRQIKSCIQ
ncbi:hypothetical protein C6W26_20310 [Bacillus halotolerans]|nr:hypothetical protein C6W26_20310 [Bacillus halotolerans]PRS23450.1 hypothetical protein C6W25_07295 [Bacillus halotolerans]